MNLQALCFMAHLGRPLDIDLWSFATPDGRGIRTAIDYLVPFWTARQMWPAQQIKPFDASGAVAILRPGLAAVWPGLCGGLLAASGPRPRRAGHIWCFNLPAWYVLLSTKVPRGVSGHANCDGAMRGVTP